MSAPSTAAAEAGSRAIKRRFSRLLEADDFAAALAAIDAIPARRAVSPLFGLFCDRAAIVRHRAAAAAGRIAARLAEREIESARVVVRRFMWNLNEESGGIGWGCPEAMAETLALSPRLAEEYGRVFTSYLRPGGNYLEHPAIQQGVLWGFGRLARAYPGRMDGCAALLMPFLACEDAARRGTAAWAAGGIASAELVPALARLTGDAELFELYRDGRLERLTVGAAAAASLAAAARPAGKAADA
jgi:hypothetical protein